MNIYPQPSDLEYLLDKIFLGAPISDNVDLLVSTVEAMDALANSDADLLGKHPALTRETYPTYLKVAFKEMTRLVPLIEAEKTVSFSVRLRHQKCLIGAFHTLTGHTRRFGDTATLHSLLRGSRSFLDSFSKKVMPSFTRHFKKGSEAVLEVLSSLQRGTRVIQQVCSHGKSGRDAKIMAVVPTVKKTLEGLLYQVKIMLSENDKVQGFWVGNLKHRALDGTEISSQMPVEEIGDSEGEPITNRRKKKNLGGSSKSAKSKKTSEHGNGKRKRSSNTDESDDDASKRPRLSATQVVDSDEGMSDLECKIEQDETESVFGKAGERDELDDEEEDEDDNEE
ncbi:Fanconi anemia group D2 protein [Gonapodya sp. JEL0774]|nr:Fanconi anemia group D2 protein [Gonapodya sp. JEL0774]